MFFLWFGNGIKKSLKWKKINHNSALRRFRFILFFRSNQIYKKNNFDRRTKITQIFWLIFDRFKFFFTFPFAINSIRAWFWWCVRILHILNAKMKKNMFILNGCWKNWMRKNRFKPFLWFYQHHLKYFKFLLLRKFYHHNNNLNYSMD